MIKCLLELYQNDHIWICGPLWGFQIFIVLCGWDHIYTVRTPFFFYAFINICLNIMEIHLCVVLNLLALPMGALIGHFRSIFANLLLFIIYFTYSPDEIIKFILWFSLDVSYNLVHSLEEIVSTFPIILFCFIMKPVNTLHLPLNTLFNIFCMGFFVDFFFFFK